MAIMGKTTSVVCVLLVLLCGWECLASKEDILDPLHHRLDNVQRPAPRVAILGAGIGGSAAAYFIHEEMKDAQIEIFEKSDRVGGRLHHLNLDGVHVELGGSIYHRENFYIRNFTLMHNFTENNFVDESSFGVWDGKSFAFEESAWKVVTIAKVLMRYGLGPVTTRKLANAQKEKWLNLYSMFDQGKSFVTVGDLLGAVGLAELAQEGFKDRLIKEGINERFIDEVATAITRINYGQNTSMNALGGFISMIGSGEDLLSAKEGHSSVCQATIESSKAALNLRSDVQKVEADRNNDGKLQYRVRIKKQDDTIEERIFDAVVIASPLESAGIEFEGMEFPPQALNKRIYQVTHVTVIAGDLDHSYFNVAQGDALPNTIGTIESAQIPFSSISKKGVGKLDEGNPIWKIFSRERMDDATLDRIFPGRSQTHRFSWNAYPLLIPTSKFPPVVLHEQLFYVNAIESAFSCMESEAVAARNIANLLKSSWK